MKLGLEYLENLVQNGRLEKVVPIAILNQIPPSKLELLQLTTLDEDIIADLMTTNKRKDMAIT